MVIILPRFSYRLVPVYWHTTKGLSQFTASQLCFCNYPRLRSEMKQQVMLGKAPHWVSEISCQGHHYEMPYTRVHCASVKELQAFLAFQEFLLL